MTSAGCRCVSDRARLVPQPLDRGHELLGVQRLSEKVTGTAPDRETHSVGVTGRSDDDERRTVTRGRLRHRSKLGQTVGIEAQHQYVGTRMQPMQGVCMTVADETGAYGQPLGAGKTSLEALQRLGGATGQQNLELVWHGVLVPQQAGGAPK